ncbi:PQQ-binding-like beta-propeller repeat protein [Natrinema halophilum]|uniref:PQQ-binding-like beta-propeller repeat protein n=1 Tax=Natrinema halophilum TaxID=1699371 RepID=A0A7D5L351_9EURY|nr:PQQ-binding-like beta-propeller repeat protein [Natrinema halophilum]QLG47465.1 PQQ-binding-like beta-propeller repeat protein [Natrinema halophilum]
MSKYDRRDVLKTTGATLIAGGVVTTGGAIGADEGASDSQPSPEDDVLEGLWTYDSYGSVSFVDGSVYLSYHEAVGEEGSMREEGMIALDVADGSIQWRNETAENPKVVDDMIYGWAIGRNGQLVALDRADGSIRWRTDLETDSHSVNLLTVAEDTAFVRAGSTLYGLETADGSVRWKVDFDTGTVGHSAPVYAGAIYLNVDGLLYAVEVDDGSIRWQKEAYQAREFEYAPIAANGHIYAASGGPAHAFDPKTGEELWNIFHDTSITIEVSSNAIAMKDEYSIRIYDLETQERITKVPNRDPFVLGDEIAIVPDEKTGGGVAIDLENATELWQTPTLRSKQGFVGEAIYYTTGAGSWERPITIGALDKRDGTTLWEYEYSSHGQHVRIEDVKNGIILLRQSNSITAFRITADEKGGEDGDCDCEDESDDQSGSAPDESGDTGDTDGDQHDSSAPAETDGTGDADTADNGTADNGSDGVAPPGDEAGTGDTADGDSNEPSKPTGDAADSGDGSDGSAGTTNDSEEGSNAAEKTPGFGTLSGLVGTIGGAAFAARRLVSSPDEPAEND